MKKWYNLLPALVALLSACTVSAPETAPVQGTPRSLDNHLYFKNVCGGMIIRFSIGCTQYRKVVIRANGLECLSA